MRRVLALVAAAAMVAGSIALRSRLDRQEEDRTDPVRIVCAAELGAVCDGLRRSTAQVTVEPAVRTADRLGRSGDDDPGLDGWVVPSPWPQIVDARRRVQALVPLFGDVSTRLARSPLVLVVQKALADRLPGCGGTVGWRCLGDAAGAVPPQAKPGHPDPGADAVGTLLVGQATAAFFGRVEDLSTADLDDPNFARWFRALERATPPLVSGGSLLEEMLGTNFATYDAVGTTEAEATTILSTSAVRDRVVLSYPVPMATADVVLASAGASNTRRLREVATGDGTLRALRESGWKVEGSGSAGTPLPATNGLPSPGFLDALRSRASEVRR